MPVLEYQLSRMLRELPRTSKKISPSRGTGAASDAEIPMLAPPAERLSTSYRVGLPRVTRDPLAAVDPAFRASRVSPTTTKTTHRKILATRGKKNATPPCTRRRQDGIIVPRLSCPPLRRIFWLTAVNGSANGHGQLSGYSALPTASAGVRRLVGARRLSRMCQPPAASKQCRKKPATGNSADGHAVPTDYWPRNLGEARASAPLVRGNSMTPLSVAACNSSYRAGWTRVHASHVARLTQDLSNFVEVIDPCPRCVGRRPCFPALIGGGRTLPRVVARI